MQNYREGRTSIFQNYCLRFLLMGVFGISAQFAISIQNQIKIIGFQKSMEMSREIGKMKNYSSQRELE